MKTVIQMIGVILVTALLMPGTVTAQELRVVTTLSTYGSLADTVGGSRVEVSTIVSPRFNPHFLEPKPSDVMKLKRADLFIHSGLDLEAWREALANASSRTEVRPGGSRELNLSGFVRLLDVPTQPLSRAQGDIHLYGNPHYWLDPRNGLAIAGAIASKLSELDPARRAEYAANLAEFTKKLEDSMARWKAAAAPFAGAEIIGYHNEWVYLMDFLGLRMTQFLEPKPGVPPSAKQIEFLMNFARQKKIRVILQPTFYGTEAGERVASGSGATLVLGAQNVGEVPEASDYISLIDYNVTKIVDALR